MPRKPSVWVLYKWELVVHRVGELGVQSKGTWQQSKKYADDNPQKYRATWLAESTDKAMLEQMRDLAKEN